MTLADRLQEIEAKLKAATPESLRSAHDALADFCKVAWNRSERVHIFTIPVDRERDADCRIALILNEAEHSRVILANLLRWLRAALAVVEAAKELREVSAVLCRLIVEAGLTSRLPPGHDGFGKRMDDALAAWEKEEKE